MELGDTVYVSVPKWDPLVDTGSDGSRPALDPSPTRAPVLNWKIDTWSGPVGHPATLRLRSPTLRYRRGPQALVTDGESVSGLPVHPDSGGTSVGEGPIGESTSVPDTTAHTWHGYPPTVSGGRCVWTRRTQKRAPRLSRETT